MSMSLDGRSTGIVPCIDLPFLGLEERNLGMENGRDESNSGFSVNPSSNSIRSATTDRSQISWRSSSSASTSATSFASTVSKGISTVWCACRNIDRVIKTPVASWAAQPRSKQCLSVDTVNLESELCLPLRPLKGDGIELASDQRSFFERQKEVTSHVTNRIQVIFDFGHETYSYGLDYDVFRRWKYMASLLSSLSADGTICVEVWDEIDRIEVTSEDWEARARPGWLVRAYCEDIRDEDVSDGNEEEELHDDEESHGDDWWFKRWKTGVEKRKEGWKMNRRPWLVGAIAMVAIGISFCTVAWLSS